MCVCVCLTSGRAFWMCRPYWRNDCLNAWRCVQGSSQWVRADQYSVKQDKHLPRPVFSGSLPLKRYLKEFSSWRLIGTKVLLFTHWVGSWEVIATHHLHVGLLYEGDPQLVSIAGVGTQQLSVVINRQVVVYNHLPGSQTGWPWWKIKTNYQKLKLFAHKSIINIFIWIQQPPTSNSQFSIKNCPTVIQTVIQYILKSETCYFITFLGTPLMWSLTMYFPQGLYSGCPRLFWG